MQHSGRDVEACDERNFQLPLISSITVNGTISTNGNQVRGPAEHTAASTPFSTTEGNAWQPDCNEGTAHHDPSSLGMQRTQSYPSQTHLQHTAPAGFGALSTTNTTPLGIYNATSSSTTTTTGRAPNPEWRQYAFSHNYLYPRTGFPAGSPTSQQPPSSLSGRETSFHAFSPTTGYAAPNPFDNGSVPSGTPLYHQLQGHDLEPPPDGACSRYDLPATPPNQPAPPLASTTPHLYTNVNASTTNSSNSPSVPTPPSTTQGRHYEQDGFRCACGKDFSGNKTIKNRRSNLLRHISEKNGTATLYYCPFKCGHSAMRKSNVKTHQKTCALGQQYDDDMEPTTEA